MIVFPSSSFPCITGHASDSSSLSSLSEIRHTHIKCTVVVLIKPPKFGLFNLFWLYQHKGKIPAQDLTTDSLNTKVD